MEKDHLWLAVGGVGELECLHDGLVVVAVCLDYFPAESGPFVAQVSHSANTLYGAVYLLAVPVREGHQIVQFMMGGPHAGLPYLALLAFSVSKETEDALGLSVYLLAQCHSGGAGKALTEGS